MIYRHYNSSELIIFLIFIAHGGMDDVVCYYGPSMSGVTLRHFTPSPHNSVIMQSGQRGALLSCGPLRRVLAAVTDVFTKEPPTHVFVPLLQF